jgi:curved DNA-binding protein CbpA
MATYFFSYLLKIMEDYYAVLGVEADASEIALKSAYRRKAAEFHPDRNTSMDAVTQFQLMQKAYDVLSDQTKRRAYDENRRRSLLENPMETAKDIWENYMKRVFK